MPNLANTLKDEIIRLARKELRSETNAVKKATSQHRSDIAALKRQVAELQRQIARLSKSTKHQTPVQDDEPTACASALNVFRRTGFVWGSPLPKWDFCLTAQVNPFTSGSREKHVRAQATCQRSRPCGR